MGRINKFIKKMLLIVIMFFVVSGNCVVQARAGGGGSSGGSGGSGGASHTSAGGAGHYRGRSNPVFDILYLVSFVLIGSGGAIVIKIKRGKKELQSISAIRDLAIDDDNWKYEEIKEDVEDAFYNIQKAWMERNQDLAKEYMSEDLYNRHKTKTEWMSVRHEKNILKNVQLISSEPMGLEDYEGIDKDSLWMLIKAKAVDYTINEDTNKVIQGQAHTSTKFEEYWKFIRVGTRWVADDIRQIDQIDDLSFFKIDVHNKKEN
ncbi:Tim44 domain-containing protein [Clostridium felsineum]|uniref:Tim44 domain-containing protein n=1 Tax=Clostridium felsineum TaxID=36839 RepID=UPI00098CD1D5|nr:Tim44-like domain-containing protein [Clostridium felsineum]URZ01615.1 hypothetical protein CLAUR_016100 [Clostridium felsineum]